MLPFIGMKKEMKEKQLKFESIEVFTGYPRRLVEGASEYMYESGVQGSRWNQRYKFRHCQHVESI